MILRDYQTEAISKLYQNWDRGIRRQLLTLPTGGGKTVIFSAIARDHIKENILVVAHREELITQAAVKLEAVTGIQPGIIKAGYPYTDSPLQVASIQTLARRRKYPPAQLVIVDECHHSAAASYRDLFDTYPESKILGVTATPRRIDGYGLSDLFDELVIGSTVRQLMADGHLCTYKLIAGFAKLGLFAPKGREFTKKELERAAKKLDPEDVLKCYEQFLSNKKTLIFAANVAHSQGITAKLNDAGIPTEHLDGTTPNAERRAILQRFRSGETLVLSNCGILTEGFDCPDIEAVQCARPTTSISLWLQIVGRALRPSPGKENAVIVDQTDNWYRLGLPCDDREWSLAAEPSEEDSPGVKHCGQCHHVFKPMEALIQLKTIWDNAAGMFRQMLSTLCPNCGHEVLWHLSEGGTMPEKEAKEQLELEIEFKEVSPKCRFEVLQIIGGIRQRGNRYRRQDRKINFYQQELCKLIKERLDINIEEIKIAADVLNLSMSSSEVLRMALTIRLQRFASENDYQGILELMHNRPHEVKQLVWGMIPQNIQQHIRNLRRVHGSLAG